MQKLTGKVAVITGGNSGIGLATAQQFIEQGASVVITGRDQRTLDQAVNALGENAYAVKSDATDLKAINALAENIKAQFGHIDILVANAGSGIFMPLTDVTEADFEQQFDLNVKGVFFTVQALVPLINRGGSVILTGSAVHEKGVATGSLYFATKAAIRSLTRTLASELAVNNIRVNTLSPGIVRTNFASNTNLDNDDFEGFISMVESQAPLGRSGTTTEIAKAAVFLASDDASYMTAADLLVDGGWMSV
ncbi:glucose 1-dehydrogenase [Alteromonas oceanisediminis]|uniref:glucose 1-dehydrogenase n=1 Tax=Alteromonas oceanisediminis TaxID=2836180 RepID=UPI001BD9235A|nr:glucose 1-dehydrogenase [Alteromonas oceanisediminis]MBT0587487.1 glucose 1-dehydrogenase [Alteromonas oceanisediminis]